MTAVLYASLSEMKTALDTTGATYLDADITRALDAASRAIEEACGQVFYPSTETRVYTVGSNGNSYSNWYAPGLWSVARIKALDIDPLVTLTTLKVDNDGDGVYETTWTKDTDFYLGPPNNPLRGYPYTRVVLMRNAGRVFPYVDNGVQIAGSFGWAAAPTEVNQYCMIFATQLLLRTREAPFGVLMAGSEVGTSARIARFDPDFERMLGHLVKPYQLIA